MNFIISIINQIDVGSALAIMALVIAALVAAAYKVGGFINRWRGSESEVKKLREQWDKDIPDIKVRVDLFTGQLQSLTDRVDSLFRDFSSGSSVKSGSPIKLTKVGEEIAAALDAEGIVQEHKTKLQELVNKENPQTAYDLQKACFSVVEKHLPDLLTEEQLNIAKEHAFNNGVPLDNALAVVGVLFRDKLLAESDWSIGDVDTHDPAKK